MTKVLKQVVIIIVVFVIIIIYLFSEIRTCYRLMNLNVQVMLRYVMYGYRYVA